MCNKRGASEVNGSKPSLSELAKRLYAGTAIAAALFVGAASAHAETIIKVAYSSDYFMSTPAMATQWFTSIKQGLAKDMPGVTLELEPIHGGFDDFLTKLSLMYGNASTAPDIAQVPGQEVAQWQVSGLLAPLDTYLASSDWWGKFVPAIQKEGDIGGKTYYISQGDGVSALLFDKTIFAKAGLPADWHPKTWEDILNAARAIKKADPSVWPIWLLTGTAQGSEGVMLGPANLLVNSSKPLPFDPATGKWIADSSGLREVVNFYKTASAEGLLAPPSEILDPNGPGIVGAFPPKHQVGITFGGNYVPQLWNTTVCGPCWADGETEIGFAPIPTVNGQPPGQGSTLASWGLVMNASTKAPDVAWKVIDYMMKKDNLLLLDNFGGLIPPISAYNKEPVYVNFAPAFQTKFADLAKDSSGYPSSTAFKVWAFAFAQATETVVLHPNTSVDDAMNGMKSYMSNQLDANQFEILK
jgi:multiple sugar transport system substrate-binding protein